MPYFEVTVGIQAADREEAMALVERALDRSVSSGAEVVGCDNGDGSED